MQGRKARLGDVKGRDEEGDTNFLNLRENYRIWEHGPERQGAVFGRFLKHNLTGKENLKVAVVKYLVNGKHYHLQTSEKRRGGFKDKSGRLQKKEKKTIALSLSLMYWPVTTFENHSCKILLTQWNGMR